MEYNEGMDSLGKKTCAMLRLLYLEMRWGQKFDPEVVPTDPDEKYRWDIAMIDMLAVGLLPERFCEQACQIHNDYAKNRWHVLF